MKFITPPENQGQIVEIAFASAGEFVIKKVFDRSDRSETFYLAEIAGDDWGWYENWAPVNGAPPGDLEWVEISERDLRRRFDLAD